MANSKGGLKGHWRKRSSTYSRLPRPPPSTVLLGSAADDTHSPAISSPPKCWFTCVCDAYVRMMLRLARAAPLRYGYGYGAADAFGPRRCKEYEEKMVVEIYKLLLSQTQAGSIIVPEAGAYSCQIEIKQ